MGLLQYLSKLYQPETLDTRFVISANAPPREAVAELESGDAASSSGYTATTTKVPNAQPSLWRTPEFFFYYIAFIIIVPLMFKSPMGLSQRRISTIPTDSKHD